jgi:hypothetical protein
MKIFSILKIDDEYSLMQYPLHGWRLDPRTAGVTTAPIDGVSVLLIKGEIF